MPDVRFYEKDEEVPALLQDVIDASRRSYRKDRWAIITELNPRLLIAPLDAELLDSAADYHWSGVQRQKRGEKTRKSLLVGNYYEWYCWFMRTQRFRAFHTIVVVDPLGSMVDYTCMGYLDGFFARLRAKPIRFVVLENKQHGQAVANWLIGEKIADARVTEAYGKYGARQAVLALLYGTRLEKDALREALSKTLWASCQTPEAAQRTILAMHGFVEKGFVRDSRLRLSERGRRFAEGLVEDVVMPDDPDEEPEVKKIIRRKQHRPRPVLPDSRLCSETLDFMKQRGWMTVPMLAKALYEHHLHLRSDEDWDFVRLLDDYPYLTLEENDQLIAPSRYKIRQLLGKLEGEGTIESGTWYQEVGRPVRVYFLRGQSSLDAQGRRCGQCAFYISLRRQCRLWWLLGRSLGVSDPRWGKDGERPLTPLELHKMRNASRIGPHPSACRKFIDKKRDYSLNELPSVCDMCGEPLSSTPGKLTECINCRTRYFRTKKRVRVLTAYEDKFQSVYLELAGRRPSVDLTRLREEQTGSGFGSLEETAFRERQAETEAEPQAATLMLFPGDKMLMKEGRLSLLGKHTVETVQLAGTMIVDHGVLEDEQIAELTKAGATVRSVASHVGSDVLPDVRYDLGSLAKPFLSRPDIGKTFAVAMAESAINASRMVAATAHCESAAEPLIAEQSRLLRRLEKSSKALLTYEALIMKRYWSIYDTALKSHWQRFGPRKRSRFVREHVMSPTGRARGYTAVDSAINYLHQRRVFKIRQANSKLGIIARGEGFLHHKRWNAEGLGLILDLADPLKFADRQKLLEAVLGYSVNWRNFHTGTDRQGMVFYYPKSEAVAILEKLGDEADNTTVVYGHVSLKLSEAYERGVLNLSSFLEGSVSTFEPFIFRESVPEPD